MVARSMKTSPLDLPPKGSLPKTDDDDPIEYYYKPAVGALYRERLRLAAVLLGGRYRKALEVGYGSGVFLPTLARRSETVAGLDLHGQEAAVEAALARIGVQAELRDGSVLDLPYDDGAFDCVVALSVFEHLERLDAALDEVRRVLEPKGVAVFGFPVRNLITDQFFKAVGYEPREIHPSSHADILGAIGRHAGLAPEASLRLPQFLPLALSAYCVCRVRAL
jgi:ubiquinone/menaquinone biosynthesis C-methylase UbiE